MPGKGELKLTGSLGDVMRESAEAARSWLRTRAPELAISHELFTESDVHLHVPAGAVPKDGPSAGVAMVTSLASLFTGRLVNPDVAVTGEITLRGKIAAGEEPQGCRRDRGRPARGIAARIRGDDR
jgi:ATP-dependent Lon protease